MIVPHGATEVVHVGLGSHDNSTTTTLAADASFTGVWEVTPYDHVGYNIQADQSGTLYIDFSPDGGTTTTFTRTVPIRADEPKFGTLVKGASRAVRARFENDSTQQGSFVLELFYGNNLFPFSATEDGEILTTVTEREIDTFIAYGDQDIAATAYAILIDKSDTANFPHSETGRIDLTAVYLFVDRTNTAVGRLRLGVITRIDGTDADISYIQGVSFQKGSPPTIERDRHYSPSQLKCSVVDGELNRILTGETETTTSVNTGTTLDTPAGTATPAVGDLIVKFQHDSGGQYNAFVSAFYHGAVSTT